MAEVPTSPVFRETHSDWVRLQTLTLLRWLAVLGQLVAIAVAVLVLQLQLPVVPCLMVVGVSAVVNIMIGHLFPQSQRLSEAQALVLLVFDLGQLTLLLYMTGGLTNPFALLVLAPVTISAAVLQLRSTVLVGVLAILFVSVLLPYNIPLQTFEGVEFMVPPLFLGGYWLSIVVGVLFLGAYSHKVATEIRAMQDAVMAAQMALAREQKLTDLGGVVAAAAHELGTPLATIKLTSTEMLHDLADRPDLQEDARLIRDQADRCRDILRSMGQAGKDDLYLRQAPLLEVLREAAQPHMARGKAVSITLMNAETPVEGQPFILRRPEIIHGLRNLVQNAVDFASSKVWIEADWTSAAITVRVTDDGPGFPSQMIGRIGDPFLRARRPNLWAEAEAAPPADRPGYEGMGLGLFIAKTLLERSGAKIAFSNAVADAQPEPYGKTQRGAVVDLKWARAQIEQPSGSAVGENVPFVA
jgi:two-component system sensor histidine kinase RegB